MVGLALALAATEIGTRVAGHRFLTPRLPVAYEPRTFDLFASGQARLRFDPDVGWSNTPGYRDSTYRNNQGGCAPSETTLDCRSPV